MRVFENRREAGRSLADALAPDYRDRADVLVLGLPRGGVPVAYEVALALNAPLDVMVVRKLGTPGQPELAMGAIASGGIRLLNERVVHMLGIPETTLETVTAAETAELERRERAYRGEAPPFEVAGRQVILIDDGVATGATLRAALAALRRLDPARVIVAVPTAPPDTCEALRAEADELVVLDTPEPFLAVGRWYRDFGQTSDEEVRDLLARARRARQEACKP